MDFHSFGARSYVRAIIAKGIAASQAAVSYAPDAAEVARVAVDRWGRKSDVLAVLRGLDVLEQKAAVPGGGTDSGEWGAELADAKTAQTEFLAAVARVSAYGRMAGRRRIPPNTPIIAAAGGATAYWTGQSKAIPLAWLDFDRTTLAALKPSALIVRSRELFEDASEEAEALIVNDLIRAVAQLVDTTAFSGSAGTPRVSPDALNYGAPTFATTGSISDDVESAIQAFSGQLSTACWVANPRTFAAMGLKAGGRGIAADLGALGGTLGGLPACATEGVTVDSDGAGSLTLIDAGAVVEVDEGVDISRSIEGTIEMSDSPAGAADTPTAAASLVSLWQSDCIALKATRRLNFILGRSQACVVISGVAPQLGS